MNAHAKVVAVDESQDIEGAAHDVLMRAEIMLTLADRFWKQIADDQRCRLMAGSFYDELAYQHHEVHKAALVLYKAVS